MLHVRVVSPPSVTGRLLEQLAALPGIKNLIVLEGAARGPGGDAVLLDVDDSAANPVFRMLRDLGLDHDDPITVQQVDASLTAPGSSYPGDRPPRPGDCSRVGNGLCHHPRRREQLLLNVVLLIVVGAGGLATQRAVWRRLGLPGRIRSPGPPR